MTMELKHLIHQKNRWPKKFKESSGHALWEKYIVLLLVEDNPSYWNFIQNIVSLHVEDNPSYWNFIQNIVLLHVVDNPVICWCFVKMADINVKQLKLL